MKFKFFKILSILVLLLLESGIPPLFAQTVIENGQVSGIWSKQGSPYLVKGDINIAAEKSLTIQPGVKVLFKGPYKINVQGRLNAVGTANDSILFSMQDTAGILSRHNRGWNGIRFDRRPVKWDTLQLRLPENELARNIALERTKNKELDTTTKISLVLSVPDLVNDTLLPLALFSQKQGTSKLAYCKFQYATALGKARPYIFGGAAYIYRYSNLAISNCVFENNRAYAGGAIYCKEAAPVITHNTIKNCSTESSGGAMVFIHSGALILNNEITDNTSKFNGGALLFYESSPYVLNNKILRNKASNNGGAISFERKLRGLLATGEYPVAENKDYASPDTLLKRATLASLTMHKAQSPYGTFMNNIVCNNSSRRGGGICLSATTLEFTNNTFSNNTAKEAGGGFYCYYSAPVLINSILSNNQAKNNKNQMHFRGRSKPVIRYCNLQSGINGITQDSVCQFAPEMSDNITSPPSFTNPGGYDYSLKINSPCIDAGMPQNISVALSSVDYMGKQRVVNNIIDIGAIEYKGKALLKETPKDNLKNALNDSAAQELQKQALINVYPNPNRGSFSVIMCNNVYEAIEIRVFNQTGEQVYHKNTTADTWLEEKINLSGRAPGVYFLLINAGDNLLYNGKVVVE